MFDLKYLLSLSLPLAVLVIYTITLRQDLGFVVVARSASSNPPRNPFKALSQNKGSTDELASKYELFLLENWCSVRCEANAARKLKTRFRCTEITVLPVLRSIQARCIVIRSMTPQQVKMSVVKKITGIKGYVNNLKLPSASIGERVHVRSISTLPPGQPKQSSFVARLIQSIAGMLPWGLDRIDQTTGEDGKFDLSCFPNLGKGVTVYVLDTGCRDTHDELKGRTRIEKVGKYETAKDNHGHGTHVAGTAAGTNYGVCKRCDIVCIKTLDENNVGTIVNVVDAVEYVLEQKKANPSVPAVAVMSLGGPLETDVLDLAVEKLAKAKVFPAVSAGNGFSDACEWTPPRAEHAVTVGATMKNDELRFSSNHGKCVNIVAPGEEVRSASHEGDSLYITMSGTSMAAPYVAGVAGLILGEDSELTPGQVLEKMKLKAKIVDDELHESTYPLLRVLHADCELYGFGALRSLPPTPSVSPIPSPSASTISTLSNSPAPSFSTSLMRLPSPSSSPSMSTSSTPSMSMSSTPEMSASPTPSVPASSSPSMSTSPSPSISTSPTHSPLTSRMPSPSVSLIASITFSETPLGPVAVTTSPSASASYPPPFSQTPVLFASTQSSTIPETPSASASHTQPLSSSGFLPSSPEDSRPSTPPTQDMSSFASRAPSPSIFPSDVLSTPSVSTFPTPSQGGTSTVTFTPSQTLSTPPSSSWTASPTFSQDFESSATPVFSNHEVMPSSSRNPMTGSIGPSASVSPYRFIADTIS